MKKNQLPLAVTVVVFLAFLAGCAQAPEQDITAAQAAMEKARESQADLYAPQALKQAEDSFNSAMAEVEAQQSKFALFRSFNHAKELLATAKTQADQAVTEANTGKEEARKEVESLIRDTRNSIEEAKIALASAPMGKGTRAEIQAMKTELETLATGLDEVEKSFNDGQYLDAKAKAQALKEKAEEIAADIAQAKAKKTRA